MLLLVYENAEVYNSSTHPFLCWNRYIFLAAILSISDKIDNIEHVH